jgi:thiol-disulfide isomerase/thioredoxin
MRVLGVLLLLVALAVLGLFLWPVVKPETVPKPAASEAAKAYRRAAPVMAEAASTNSQAPGKLEAAAAGAHPGEAAAGATGPLCDKVYPADRAPLVRLPQGKHPRGGDPRARPGQWQWLNLWAAWCKPCKEEMPILSDWARTRDGKRPHPIYLSLDDDERQLRRYLDEQGGALAGEFLWLDDDDVRAAFFGAVDLPNPPTLPVQLVLDPQGRLRCVRVGSISRAELDEATRVFGW